LKPLISVIIPIYNVEEYLDKCIESVIKQTYPYLEIVLVDDGSPDDCPVKCDEWALRDERIVVIHKENGGLSDARNAGLKIATGEYISFVDSDDWIANNMYETMMGAMQAENADICACGLMITYPECQEPLNMEPMVGSSEKILEMIYQDTTYLISAVNKLYHRKCWAGFEFPVGKICEDAFTAYLLVERANKIVQISDALYYYRIRENSIMTSPFSQKRMDEEEAWRCNYEYMAKYHPAIKQKAFDFYLQKVNILIHTITEAQRIVFLDEYKYLYTILKDNLWYILFFSKLSWKYRLKFLLEFLQL